MREYGYPVQSQADILFCLFPLLLHQIPQFKASSGHKLIFTEDESILLTDKNGNVIKLDTQGKNIEISAPETINITTKNINLKASDSIDFDANVNITETAGKAKRSDIGGDMFVYVNGALTEVIEGDLHSETKKRKTMLNSEGGIESNSAEMINLNAEGKMERNNITDNIMDYSSIQYCFYEYQFEVIKKLYNEFKHI